MKLRDFIILMVCCLCWGSNFVVSSWVIGGHNIPPMFLAFVRAAIVLLVMAPFLFKKLPEHFWRLILVCLFIGPLHLAFLYTGLITAPASSSSIVA
ncbi:MAG: EamA family transporter, partial [Robiginitomaculum sp.]